MGGGLGVAYKEEDQAISPEEYAKKLMKTIYETCKKYDLRIQGIRSGRKIRTSYDNGLTDRSLGRTEHHIINGQSRSGRYDC